MGLDINGPSLANMISQRIGLSKVEEETIKHFNLYLGQNLWFNNSAVWPATDLYIKWLNTDQNRYLGVFKQYLIASAYERNLHYNASEGFPTRGKDTAERSGEKGYIYVIKAGDRYKIGRAKNNGNRLQSHQTSSPYEVTLVFEYETDDYVNTELELHELFAKKRLKGEWFALDENDLRTITEYFSD